MPTADVSMNVRKANEQSSVIEIHGEMTAFAEDALMDAYSTASNGSTRAVILDFNSSGIGLLVTLLIRANRQNQQLMVIGLNDHYRQIFQLTRLDEAIGIFDSESNALAAVS